MFDSQNDNELTRQIGAVRATGTVRLAALAGGAVGRVPQADREHAAPLVEQTIYKEEALEHSLI